MDPPSNETVTHEHSDVKQNSSNEFEKLQSRVFGLQEYIKTLCIENENLKIKNINYEKNIEKLNKTIENKKHRFSRNCNCQECGYYDSCC